MTDQKTPVWVTIAVNVGGETKTFSADATTANDPYELAVGILSGLDQDADRWLRKQGYEARQGY
jgi:hypothetical protein